MAEQNLVILLSAKRSQKITIDRQAMSDAIPEPPGQLLFKSAGINALSNMTQLLEGISIGAL